MGKACSAGEPLVCFRCRDFMVLITYSKSPQLQRYRYCSNGDCTEGRNSHIPPLVGAPSPTSSLRESLQTGKALLGKPCLYVRIAVLFLTLTPSLLSQTQLTPFRDIMTMSLWIRRPSSSSGSWYFPCFSFCGACFNGWVGGRNNCLRYDLQRVSPSQCSFCLPN